LAGAITSSVVQLAVTPTSRRPNGQALMVDFDMTGALNTGPGFSSNDPGHEPHEFRRSQRDPFGHRPFPDRPGPASTAPRLRTTTRPCRAAVYNDFVFCPKRHDQHRSAILIEGWRPIRKYGLTIWSFDSKARGGENLNWIETASGSRVTIQKGYTFDGAVLPAHDGDDYSGRC